MGCYFFVSWLLWARLPFQGPCIHSLGQWPIIPAAWAYWAFYYLSCQFLMALIIGPFCLLGFHKMALNNHQILCNTINLYNFNSYSLVDDKNITFLKFFKIQLYLFNKKKKKCFASTSRNKPFFHIKEIQQ